MGSKTSSGQHASLKRKRESESVEDSAGGDYFFAKYLTSPELLDLEVSVESSILPGGSAAHYTLDRRHPLPPTIPFPTPDSPRPPTHLHQDQQSRMDEHT